METKEGLYTVQSYIHDLKQYKAFVPIDNSLHRFVLQDFNSEDMQLKVMIVHICCLCSL